MLFKYTFTMNSIHSIKIVIISSYISTNLFILMTVRLSSFLNLLVKAVEDCMKG